MRKSINSIQFKNKIPLENLNLTKIKKNINKKRLDLTGKKQMNDEIVKNSNKKNMNQFWYVKISIGGEIKKKLNLIKRTTVKLEKPLNSINSFKILKTVMKRIRIKS